MRRGLEISAGTNGETIVAKYIKSQPTWGGEEALQGFHRNREAKRKEENPINKSSKNFSSVPAIRISGITSTGTFL
jgi:hypothetical protein